MLGICSFPYQQCGNYFVVEKPFFCTFLGSWVHCSSSLGLAGLDSTSQGSREDSFRGPTRDP